MNSGASDSDEAKLRKHRHAGSGSDVWKRMRTKFADAFSSHWKCAGLEAEARRLLSLQQAVRELGEAGMAGKGRGGAGRSSAH